MDGEGHKVGLRETKVVKKIVEVEDGEVPGDLVIQSLGSERKKTKLYLLNMTDLFSGAGVIKQLSSGGTVVVNSGCDEDTHLYFSRKEIEMSGEKLWFTTYKKKL